MELPGTTNEESRSTTSGSSARTAAILQTGESQRDFLFGGAMIPECEQHIEQDMGNTILGSVPEVLLFL